MHYDKQRKKDLISQKKFPLLTDKYPKVFIDWNYLNEEWALKNHGQTLERLAKRGGLSAKEVVMNIEKIKGCNIGSITDEFANEYVSKLIILM